MPLFDESLKSEVHPDLYIWTNSAEESSDIASSDTSFLFL